MLIDQQWMFNEIQKTRKEIIYTKKERMTIQSLNQRWYFNKYRVIV